MPTTLTTDASAHTTAGLPAAVLEVARREGLVCRVARFCEAPGRRPLPFVDHARHLAFRHFGLDHVQRHVKDLLHQVGQTMGKDFALALEQAISDENARHADAGCVLGLALAADYQRELQPAKGSLRSARAR
jgi:hypothetical protein